MAKMAGLGRGLGSLLGEAAIEVGAEQGDAEKSTPHQLPLHEVVPNPDQPRKVFDEEALEELADSIRQNGILQPIVVRNKNNAY